MTTKIEEVARAIYREFENRPIYAQAQMNGLIALDLARAAIEAMKTPTMQQEIEGRAALILGRRVHGNDFCPSPCAVYVAMIDAALNEGKE